MAEQSAEVNLLFSCRFAINYLLVDGFKLVNSPIMLFGCCDNAEGVDLL